MPSFFEPKKARARENIHKTKISLEITIKDYERVYTPEQKKTLKERVVKASEAHIDANVEYISIEFDPKNAHPEIKIEIKKLITDVMNATDAMHSGQIGEQIQPTHAITILSTTFYIKLSEFSRTSSINKSKPIDKLISKLEEIRKLPDSEIKTKEFNNVINEYMNDSSIKKDKISSTDSDAITADGGNPDIQNEMKKHSALFLKLVVTFGAIFALYFILKIFTDGLSGCYQYIGSTSTKINCNKNFDAISGCGCGLSSGGDGSKKAICNDTNIDRVYCSANCSGIPNLACSDSISADNTSVYYAYKQITPASVMTGVIDTVFNAPSSMLNSLAKYLKSIGYGALIILCVILLSKFIYGKMNEKKIKNE